MSSLERGEQSTLLDVKTESLPNNETALIFGLLSLQHYENTYMVSSYSVSGVLFQQHQWFKTVSMSSFRKHANECPNGVFTWKVYNHKVRNYLALFLHSTVPSTEHSNGEISS